MSTYSEVKTTYISPQESFDGIPAPDEKKLLTTEGLFLAQNAGAIPKFDIENYRLAVTGLVKKELHLSFEDIQEEFPKVYAAAQLPEFDGAILRFEGAGFDRSAANPLAADGTPLRFAGIRLRHVLLAAGVNPDTRFVAFSGLDDELGTAFSGLIPIRKAMSPEVILAYELNNEPLPISLGFPLRIIVPANDKTLSLKWITEIRLLADAQETPLEKQMISEIPLNRDLRAGQAEAKVLPEAPAVIAVICNPKDGETVLDNLVIVEGYAMAIEGRPIVRVGLSNDGGKSWSDANILKNDNPWAWCFWEAYLKLRSGSHQILVQAFDDEGNSNGIQMTHPHSIRLKIVEDD